MGIAAQVRHPNLLLFIGATSTQGQSPIILTELMPTSLHAQLQRARLSQQQIKSIAIDVSCGLRYLHEKKPSPIVHRDVSSPNVLMQPFGASSWRGQGLGLWLCQLCLSGYQCQCLPRQPSLLRSQKQTFPPDTPPRWTSTALESFSPR